VVSAIPLVIIILVLVIIEHSPATLARAILAFHIPPPCPYIRQQLGIRRRSTLGFCPETTVTTVPVLFAGLCLSGPAGGFLARAGRGFPPSFRFLILRRRGIGY
jgi:hypothetical protein